MKVSFLRPIDQFDGTRRFLQELKGCLDSDNYSHARIAVAFAKSGPLLRLADYIHKWRQKNKTIEAILGIDLLGTSKQALEFALGNFDKTYVTHTSSSITFHPKLYLFYGEHDAVCYLGSHNLTVGGTETNLEGGIKLEITLPDENTSFQEALSCWTSLLPAVCPMTLPLDGVLLGKLIKKGLIFDEKALKPKVSTNAEGEGIDSKEIEKDSTLFPKLYGKPPSAIPKDAFAKAKTLSKAKPAKKVVVAPASLAGIASEALAIQIVPHPNGEVFLSKVALNQNPTFFGYPFTGKTVPKKAKNPPYFQRIPDPVVNVAVYDKNGNPTLTKKNFKLNTVYYKRKADIRITFAPDLRKATSPYAVMVMRQAGGELDYVIDIYNPGSKLYAEYVAVCNQTLPSGGKSQSRKMGWL